MVIGVLYRDIFRSCQLRIYVTEHESLTASDARETTNNESPLRSPLEHNHGHVRHRAARPLPPHPQLPPHTVTFQDLTPGPSRASSISLPSSELLQAHAARGRVLYATCAASIFERIEDEEPILNSCGDPGVRPLRLPVPDPDGASFWRDLVVGAGDSRAGPDRHTKPSPSPSSRRWQRDLLAMARVLRVPPTTVAA